MNYQKIYDQIIERSRSENRKKFQGIYYENHHIIPVCLGGNYKKENLVLLTGREHFIAHELLVFIYPNNDILKRGLRSLMKFTKLSEPNAKEYEKARLIHSENRKLNPTPVVTGSLHRWFGSNKTGINNPHYGFRADEELSKIYSDANYNKEKVVCKYCGRVLDVGNVERWHNENCPQNPNYVPKEKENIICKYCGFIGNNESTMKGYHGDNCPQNPDYQPKPFLVCEHCGYKGSSRGGGFKRWHGDNCRNKILNNE